MRLVVLHLLAVGMLISAPGVPAQDAARGAEAYKLCAGCHGFGGQGNRLVNAPALAGLDAGYLDRQITNFRDGLRGHVKDDRPGQIMGKMALGLDTKEEIRDIVAYIRSLPGRSPKRTLDGNADAGGSAYAVCAACHGADGRGNAQLNAPGLVYVDDWYQLAQLVKFKSGQRGSAQGDVYGQQMVPMVQALGDEQAMKDLIAYIASLD